MVTIQIVEDHKLLANSLCKMINDSGTAQVIDLCYDLKSCREALAKTLPDILLLDIGLPDGNGVDFCAEILKIYPELKIIMLTSFKEFNIARHSLDNGALGYILKNAEPEEMYTGIEIVSRGEQFLCEEIDLLLKENKNEETIWLTNSEKTVLKYLAEGYTRKEIAALLYRDEETIKTHRKNLSVKLKPKNLADLIRKGYEMKLI